MQFWLEEIMLNRIHDYILLTDSHCQLINSCPGLLFFRTSAKFASKKKNDIFQSLNLVVV